MKEGISNIKADFSEASKTPLEQRPAQGHSLGWQLGTAPVLSNNSAFSENFPAAAAGTRLGAKFLILLNSWEVSAITAHILELRS